MGIVRADEGRAPEPRLIADKLIVFESIRADLQVSLSFVQAVHGQQRCSSFPISSTVRYLHALWVCDCKDLLLNQILRRASDKALAPAALPVHGDEITETLGPSP